MKQALIMVIFVSMMGWAQQPSRQQQTNCCDFLEKTLSISEQIKAGQTRADIEKAFELDGGISSPQRATYTFKGCRYLKLDVEFRVTHPDRKIEREFDPQDIITSVSRLYVYYPTAD